MRIAHTADWHMGKRLGFIDRGDDIKRCIRQIANLCDDNHVDVLLVCGDLFDGSTRPELVREWMEFLNQTFALFLQRGGTILALTGNHDNEHLAQALRHTMQLAAPEPNNAGGFLKTGRLYLFDGPTFFRLADASGAEVQFVVMPSPKVARYIRADAQRFNTVEERNRALKTAFKQRLDSFVAEPAYDKTKHTVLAAHICTGGADIGRKHTLNEADTILLQDADLPTGFAYVALGDIHRAQTLMGLEHVRYCGSIDRMDLGESEEEKGIVLVDIGADGLEGQPRWVKLDATPIYRVRIDNPATQMPALAERYPDRERALVHLTICPGRDGSLPALVAELNGIFPRCYARELGEVNGHPVGDATSTEAAGSARVRTVRETVHDYLKQRLADHPDHETLLALVDQLLIENNEGTVQP
jgi:DNA repair protein SbcD/Mre11